MPSRESSWTLARVMALKALPAFAHLEADDLSVLAERAQHRRFRDGDALFDATSGPEEAYLVIQGAVREERLGRPFRRVVPYDLVAPMDLLGGRGGGVAARAEEDAAALVMPRELLLGLLEENFDALLGAAREVAASAIQARRRLGPLAGHAERADGGRSPAGELDLVERILLLRRHVALGGARLSTLCQLALEAQPHRAPAGELFWKAGDPADHGLMVVSGRVACETEDGRQRFEVGAGGMVGMDDSLSLRARWHDARAAEAGWVLRVPSGRLIDLLEDDPPTAVTGLVGAARRVTELLDRVAARQAEAS